MASASAPAFFPAFRRGFLAVVPLWLGVAPFAVAYAVTARAGGLSVWETCLMSLTTFAGASQFAAAGLFGSHASGVGIVLTTFLLNVRHLLYGMSLGRQLHLTAGQRVLAGQFLTDEAYGISLVQGHQEPGGLSFAFLLGAEMSVFVSWNVVTLLGAWAGSILPSPEVLGVGVIFPLAFLGLLIPLVTDRVRFLVAAVSGLVAWGVSRALPGGLTVLIAGVGGALLGAALLTRLQAQGHGSQESA